MVIDYYLAASSLPRRIFRRKERIMNNIVWLVGAVVIVVAVLGYFGMR